MGFESNRVGDVTVTLIPAGADNYIYLVTWDDGAAVIDPAEASSVLTVVENGRLNLEAVLATHHHGDHVGGIPRIKKELGGSVIGPAGAQIAGVDRHVREGDVLDIGPLRIEVLATPGHTATDVTYYASDLGIVWCGDTLFAAGCGRLFECGPDVMWASLMKLAALPDDTLVYCGHEYTEGNLAFARHVEPGNGLVRDRLDHVKVLRSEGKASLPTTIGEEKRTNPFLRSNSEAMREALGMPGASDIEVFAELRRRKDRF